MRLTTIFFSILFASTACTQPTPFVQAGGTSYILDQFPRPPGGTSHILEQSPRPPSILGSPGGTVRTAHSSTFLHIGSSPHQLGSHDIPTVNGLTCGVTEAWKGRVGKLIEGWPDVDEAYETTFKGGRAVITKETVSLAGKQLLSNDLNALQLTGQLFGYATQRNTLHTTYYIVRKWMGDTWETASGPGNDLSLLQTGPFIRAAKNKYQEKYHIVPEKRKDEQKLYAFFKNAEGVYAGAVPISWKKSSLVPYNKLRKVNNAHYCVEKW